MRGEPDHAVLEGARFLGELRTAPTERPLTLPTIPERLALFSRASPEFVRYSDKFGEGRPLDDILRPQ